MGRRNAELDRNRIGEDFSMPTYADEFQPKCEFVTDESFELFATTV